MVLGGNVPDKFLEHLLLESKENAKSSSSEDTHHLNDDNRCSTGSSENTLDSTDATQMDDKSTQPETSVEKSKAA